MLGGITLNLLVTAFLVGLLAYFSADLALLRRRPRALITGGLMGVTSAFSMLYAVPVQEGTLVDLRAVPLALAGFAGGPVAAAIAVASAAGVRIAIGGASLIGLFGILLAGVGGLVAKPLFHRGPVWAQVTAVAVVTALVPVVTLSVQHPDIAIIAGLAMLNFSAAMLAGLAVVNGKRRANERLLFLSAIRNAPDYLYIKDKQSRLVAFSRKVLLDSGRASEADLVGETDLGLAPDGRSMALFDAEQRMLGSGAPMDNVVENIHRPDGESRWFMTSKAPVLDADGRAIGLVGITRDVTEERRRGAEIESFARQLANVMAGMADGVAVYDLDCRLIFCNDQYHDMFPLTRDVRMPGTPLQAILRAAVARGEQMNVPDDGEAWIKRVLDGVRSGQDEEVRLADGRAQIVRNRVVDGLGFVSVVSDITEIRRAEDRLAELTEQLRALATTDPLTGLTNRRALDETLIREVADAARNGRPVSVAMIDVDHFKSYNDHYGHPGGDRCLQLVSDALRAAASRAEDTVARFGGEEFCLVLPDTDEAAALVVGERVRSKVLATAVPHAGNDTGTVTVSIGVATWHPDATDSAPGDLVARADRALYLAKAGGRNQCRAAPSEGSPVGRTVTASPAS